MAGCSAGCSAATRADCWAGSSDEPPAGPTDVQKEHWLAATSAKWVEKRVGWRAVRWGDMSADVTAVMSDTPQVDEMVGLWADVSVATKAARTVVGTAAQWVWRSVALMAEPSGAWLAAPKADLRAEHLVQQRAQMLGVHSAVRWADLMALHWAANLEGQKADLWA